MNAVFNKQFLKVQYVDNMACKYIALKRIIELMPVSEENLSARPMCPGGHVFLGNSVLPDRIYCPF